MHTTVNILRKNCLILLICLSYILNSNWLNAQDDLIFRRLSPVGGFTDMAVFKIVQDKYGLIWVATSKGLFKYNSYSFEEYKIEEPDSIGPSHFRIQDLLIDGNDNFWVGTHNGVYTYNFDTDKFDYIFRNGESGESKRVLSFAHGKENTLLVAFFHSLYRYKPGSQTHYQIPLPHKDLDNIYESSQGTIYVSFKNNGVYKSSDSKNFTSIIPPSSNPVISSYLTDSMIYLAYKDMGVYIYSRHGKLIEHLSAEKGNISHNVIKSIFEDSRGNIWIGTYDGLDVKQKNTFSHYKFEDNNPYSLPNSSVYCVYEDRLNNYWVGTWSGGLSYYNKFDNLFEHEKHQIGINSITHNYINCFTEDKNDNLWIGTNRGGLNKFNSKTNKYERIHLNKDSEVTNIKALHEKDGKIYVGTFLDGLFVVDKNGKVSKIKTPKALNRIYGLASDEKGIWIAEHVSGLSYYNLDSTAITHRYTQSNDSCGLTTNYLSTLFYDNGDLWVGSTLGLNLKKKGTDSFIKYRYDQNDPSSISSDEIVCINKDIKGNIWIGTRSGGLNKYNPKKDNFIRYTAKDGLAGNDANCILSDEQGMLWISTENGISKLDPVANTIMNYKTSDGLQGNQFNRNSGYKSSTGKLYFGGTNGFSVITPSTIKYNPAVPNPLITKLRINNATITTATPNSPLKESIAGTRKIKLKHNQSSLTFSLFANNYLNPEKNIFTYRLIGENNNWVKTPSNTVSYNNLKPGNYIFELKACNNDGICSKHPKTLNITIRPPWWFTKLAFALYLFFLSSILWLIRSTIRAKHQIRMENIKRDNEEKINNLKLEFFTNISHEFKTPLTLILSPIQRIINSKDLDKDIKSDLEIAKKNAFRLKKLVNQFIELRKIDQAKLKLYLTKTEIASFTEDIYSCFNELAVNKHIDYDYDQQIEPTNVLIDNEKIDKVLFNILSNAFKYTPEDGQIRISLKNGQYSFPDTWNSFTIGSPIQKQKINIIITDSGPGIKEEDLSNIFERFYIVENASQHKGSGIGLSLTREYLLLHKFCLTVASKPSEGSLFVIEIPSDNKQLLNEPHVELIENAVKLPIKHENLNINKSITLKPCDPDQNKKDLPLVLLVEDNDELRNYLHKILAQEYRTVTAVNGEEGILMTKKLYPEIIISDVMMPVKDGLELCRTVKSDLLTSHIPVILLTALAEDASKIKGLETGADAYISKPFDVELLITQIQNLLEIRKKLRISIGDTKETLNKKEALSSLDAALLKKAKKFIEDNITNPDLSTNDLADELAMSRTNLHRKLKSLNGQSATQFIKSIKLNYAMKLIDKGNHSMEDVCFASGFNSTSYFSKCFKEYCKMSPSDYKNRTLLK